MSDSPQSKASLRKKLKKSAATSPKDQSNLSAILTVKLARLIQTLFPQGAKIANFAGLPSEPDLSSLITLLQPQPNYPLYYPKITGENSMDFFHVVNATDLKKGTFDILEPIESCEIVEAKEIDLILCPGEAFSKSGLRLGKGGGFYDRFIPQTEALRIGICFARRIVKDLPIEAHDSIMNFIVTENEVIEVT